MNPEKVIFQVELAQRTLVNYRFIHNAKERGENVYEVTQLVTGMISFFVWVKEKYTAGNPYKNSFVVTWRELGICLNQRPFPNAIQQNLNPVTTYAELIYYLRNAFAHGNFSFEEKGGEISGITLWNIPGQTSGTPNWSCTMTIRILDNLARTIVYDLNEAACQKYMKTDSAGMPVHQCPNCSFKWLGINRPPKCLFCSVTPKWNIIGYLHFPTS